MLKEILTQATYAFINEALGQEVKATKFKAMGDDFYVSKIHIKGEENYDFYIYIKKETLKKMALLFLYEKNPTEDILKDLIKEIANIIIGKAKVLASLKNIIFDISTPEFIRAGATPPKNNDLEINFMFEGRIFSIIGEEK